MTVIKRFQKIVMTTISLAVIISAVNPNFIFAAKSCGAVDPVTINYNVKKEKIEVSDGEILDKKLPWEIGEVSLYMITERGRELLSRDLLEKLLGKNLSRERVSRDFFLLFNLQNERNRVIGQKIFCNKKLLDWVKADFTCKSLQTNFSRPFHLQIVGNLCCEEKGILYSLNDQCLVNIFIEGFKEYPFYGFTF